jgi:anti-sigma regulatory factor (Ser/Thr protein kinase)
MQTESMTDPPRSDSTRSHGKSETRVFRSSDSELRKMSEWFRRFAAESGLPEGRALDLELCLNEIVTNINHYAYQEGAGEHDVRVTIERKDGALEATIEDDGRPFNPLDAGPLQRPESIEASQVGGWGIPIFRALADEVRYERRGDANLLTLLVRDSGKS